jgi:DNA-binding transcriptional MerR regulator
MEYKNKIIELLKDGFTITEISEYLKENNFETSSLSSVEKYVYKLKKEYKAKTMFQLAHLMFK